ncbi:MAG TPA: tetraacyldisaccharide 4'-kinase [Xanthobacteraceae bacterium]|nr:tetraacyldisaccharide 4'-kinase [Xanthobacteraceae bacterium]
MREPAFWRSSTPLAQLLAPAALIYAAIADARMRRAGARAGVPVLCVGNFTVGGAGKTPSALTLAKLLLARSMKPFFLTRGYGGRARGPLLVQAGHTAAEVGDEALVLARLAPTIVAHDRAAGADAAVAAGANVIVMDDGFQNPALEKDFALVVIDGERGIGNGWVFPAGPLRASLDVQLAYADAILVMGGISSSTRQVMARARAGGIPVLTGQLVPDPQAVAALQGRKVLAYAGIGNPDKFLATLAASGIYVAEARRFADHHPFTPSEAKALLQVARRGGLTLVTTEKDMARLRGDERLAALADASSVLPVTMAFDDEAAARRDVIDGFMKAASG